MQLLCVCESDLSLAQFFTSLRPDAAIIYYLLDIVDVWIDAFLSCQLQFKDLLVFFYDSTPLCLHVVMRSLTCIRAAG